VVYKPVAIGDDVWIGAGAVILPGVQIGDHAVIGSCALVRKDVAPWSIVGGVPAKVIGDRRPRPQVVQRESNAQ
jgi:acetyltransferase-like isoleucine patch superfamily enzyme